MMFCSISFFDCNKNSESESSGQTKVIEFTQAEISLSVGTSVQAEVITEKKKEYLKPVCGFQKVDHIELYIFRKL